MNNKPIDDVRDRGETIPKNQQKLKGKFANFRDLSLGIAAWVLAIAIALVGASVVANDGRLDVEVTHRGTLRIDGEVETRVDGYLSTGLDGDLSVEVRQDTYQTNDGRYRFRPWFIAD